MKRADVLWRYLPRGRGTSKTKHALVAGGLIGHGRVALCGRKTWDIAEWLGTGDQREYETAAGLRECGNCLRQIEEESA